MNPLVSALFGGILIGLGASLLLLASGKIAGVSGIVAGVLPGGSERGWRAAFVAGLLVGGLTLAWLRPELFVCRLDRSYWALGAAGLLVGFGTRLGNGCTS